MGIDRSISPTTKGAMQTLYVEARGKVISLKPDTERSKAWRAIVRELDSFPYETYEQIELSLFAISSLAQSRYTGAVYQQVCKRWCIKACKEVGFTPLWMKWAFLSKGGKV